MTVVASPAHTAATATPWTQRLLRHPWLDGPALSFFLEELNPMWSLVESQARVRAIHRETHDTLSIELVPGWGWPGFIAGQHVGVAVEINGISHRRRYSISSGPQARRRDTFTITVKREPGGKVSNWLHDQLRPGDRLRVAPPDGDFILPQPAPRDLLMLAAGSGITPLMAQLRALLASEHAGSIVLLHYLRSAEDRIFAGELESLQARHPNLQVLWCLESSRDQSAERFSPAQIAVRVPDYAQRHTLLCGPAGFMAAIRQHWDERQLNARLQFEYFGQVPALHPPTRHTDAHHPVELAGRRRHLQVGAQQPLLVALEAGGESPPYGCRQGICQSCKCRKRSGQVRNLITGQVSREPDEDIQLCISAAESALVLDY